MNFSYTVPPSSVAASVRACVRACGQVSLPTSANGRKRLYAKVKVRTFPTPRNRQSVPHETPHSHILCEASEAPCPGISAAHHYAKMLDSCRRLASPAQCPFISYEAYVTAKLGVHTFVACFLGLNRARVRRFAGKCGEPWNVKNMRGGKGLRRKNKFVGCPPRFTTSYFSLHIILSA
jgi:hypothetical protein